MNINPEKSSFFSNLKGDDAKVENVFRLLRKELENISYISEGEATSIARLIFHSLKGWDATALFCHYPDLLSGFILQQIDSIFNRLKSNEPIQYILGEGRFYGMNLEVNKATLIPRPETEELVDLIIKTEGKSADLRILDVGTGSGAIAIALSRNLLFPEIIAVDISAEAIATAKRNAKRLHAEIRFMEEDIFSFSPEDNTLDIIVSNPPYIPYIEKKDMQKNVLDYEPASALFVRDEEPLIFYEVIASVGLKALKKGGRLYFEINPRYASELKTMLENMGYAEVEVFKDMSNRERFIRGVLQL